MSEHAHVQKNPLGLFAILAVIPFAGLLLSNVLAGATRIFVIFGMAGVGTYIVLWRMAEFGEQPRWVRVLWTSAVVALGIFFIGIFLDMVHPATSLRK